MGRIDLLLHTDDLILLLALVVAVYLGARLVQHRSFRHLGERRQCLCRIQCVVRGMLVGTGLLTCSILPGVTEMVDTEK